MSDSEALKIGVTPKVAITVDNVISMINRPGTNLNERVDTAADCGSVNKADLSISSTANNDECTTNPVGESQCQKANIVKHLSQTQVTHTPTSSMDSIVSKQNPNSSKRVIRKIMVIDPKKLQQTGLDRKLAEAIGRQKLKALAKEKKKATQSSDSPKLQLNNASDGLKSQLSAKLANKPTQADISSVTATSAQAVVPATVATTYTATSNSTSNTTNSTQQIFTAIKPLESLKNCLLVPSASEIVVPPIINATPINATIAAQSASKSPAVERKVFVTPKITITRPGEESPTLRIVPEHRLENVKYILQCKILKRQQLTAVKAPQSPSVANVSKSPHTPPTSEVSWIEPKEEMEEFINIPKVQRPKKPSPAKTPQDIARVLDFSADAASASATSPKAKENKVEKVSPNSPLHIKNYSFNACKVSPVKDETAGTRAVDVARLVARISNVTMRKTVAQSPDKALIATEPMEIPKATIRCKKLPVKNKLKNMSNREELLQNVLKQSPEPKEKPKGAPLITHTNVCLTSAENTTRTLFKDPLKQPTATLHDTAATGVSIDNQNNEHSQFNNFPLFSPLKQPFPVVTHSQDLPLPTISTFKTPFPTTLIKVGQMGQPQSDAVEKTNENFLKNTYFVTPAVPIPVTQTPKSLIVLENKVLSQDEKIDLTALGFGTPKIESTPEVTMETSESKATAQNTQETEQTAQTKVLPSSSVLVKNVLPQKGATFNNRTIVSMDKLKLSSDKIAELVKAIQLKNANSAKHFLVVRKTENAPKTSENRGQLSNVSINDASSSQTNAAAATLTQPTENSASVDFPPLYNNSASIQKTTETSIGQTPNIPVTPLSEFYTSTATHNDSPQQQLSTSTPTITTTVSTSFITDTAAITYPEAKNPEVSQFKNPLPPNPQKFSDSDQNAHNKSSVCVLDSGDESDVPLSAVDFIASLAAENPITEDMQLELSPEELNLNASFAMNFSPLRIPNRDRTESVKSELIEQDVYEACSVPNAETLPELFESEMASDEMQIGKIITISEENILKAVAASNKLGINNEQPNVGTQEVFKLTKSTERLDVIHEESQDDNLENVNNLDIVTTDSLTESTVGPIIVKNIEIGAIDNFEESNSTAVIVKNMDNGMAESIGQIGENIDGVVPDTNQIQILPLTGEVLSKTIFTVEENITDEGKTDSKTAEETSTVNAIETSQTVASIPDVINVDHKNTEVEPSVEVKANVSLADVEGKNIGEVPSPHKPNALAESEKQVGETTKIESITANTKTESESTEIPTLSPVHNNHLITEKNAVSSENVKPAVGENSNAAPRRLPRFKKGKINLVQRKKTTASAPQTKPETKSLSKNVNQVSSDQKPNEKKVAIEETAATSKLDRETNERVEKNHEYEKVNEKEAAIVTKSVSENINEVSSDHKLNKEVSSIEEIADPSSLDKDTDEGVEKMNEDPKVNEKEAAIEAKSVSENINEASSDEKLNDKASVIEEIADSSSLNTDINEEVVNSNETTVQTNELKCEVQDSETLSHNLAESVHVNEGAATEEVLVAEKNTALLASESGRPTSEVVAPEISVPDISSNNETSWKSGDLKRKKAIISELLHPPKIPKRKSIGTDIKPDISAEQPSYTDNLLLSAVKAATEDSKVTPAKNPFKKTKVEAISDQPSIKGIQNLLTKFNKDHNTSEIEYVDSGKTSEDKEEEVVSAEGNLQENNTEKKLQENCEQKTERLSNLVQEEAQGPNRTDENTPQSNTVNSVASVDSAITANAEVHKTSKNCDILHVITEERLLEQNADEKMPKADTSSAACAEKPGNLKSDFLGFNHNSPSTHNIENNLQHILTITTSAEKTKTRDVNYSTAERESPHVSLSDSSVKSSSTTGKTTSRKSKLAQGRKSTNRRSVPLKKRWGVLHESDDDINITDDTSPADDDEEEDDEHGLQTSDKTKESNMNKIKIAKSDTERKGMEGEKEKESLIKDAVATDVTDTVFSESKKRNRCSEDSTDAGEHASDTVTVAENTASEDSQAPSKKIRLDAKSENIATSKSVENSESLAKESETELSEMPQVNVLELEATLQDAAANEVTNVVKSPNTSTRASVDSVINIKAATPKPKSKGGRKHKSKTPLIGSSNARAVEESTETAKPVDNKDASLLGTAAASDKDERVNSEDLMKKDEVVNEKSSARERRSKALEMKEPFAKVAEPVALQPKSGKKRGRKSKVNAADTTTPITSLVAESELAESTENSVDCSMSESVKTETNERKKLAVEKQKHAVQQEFTTSTPTIEQTPEASTAKRGRKRKLVVEPVEEDKNETMNIEESTPVLRKKRGRKPKSSLLNDTEDVICNGVAEAEKTVDITQESFQQDLNETLSQTSLNKADAANATTEFETPIKVPKKRGRKPKALLATPDTSANSESPKLTEKSQGRRGKVVDLETRGTFNERLLLITNRSQLDTDEVLTAEQSKAKKSKTSWINCGLCLQQMERVAWVNHLATHYGVGWIVGEMTPINVTIRNEVLKAMTAFLKVNAGKYPLTCRMCQRTYRSALGTLLHIEVCGATDTRVPCDYCKKEYSKLSVVSHMRLCSKRMEDEENAETATEVKESADDSKEAVFNNVGRLKRASVQKAEKMLKAFGSDSQSTGIYSTKDAKNHVEFVAPVGLEKLMEKCAKDLETTGSAKCLAQGCKFSAKDLSAVKEHFESCALKDTISKGVYTCKLCVNTTKSYRSAKYVIKHILQQHKSTEIDEEFEADGSDCGIKTDDESSGDDDDVSSGVDSNEESNNNDNESDNSFEEGEARKNVKKKKTVKKKAATSAAWSNAITADRLHPPRETDYSGTARLLWKEFSTQNYSTVPLFTDVNVKYTICARSDYETYIPDMETSMNFHYKSDLKLTKGATKVSFGKAEELNWSQLQLLETTSVKNEQFTFLGEAINTVTWVPLPTDIKEQYLLLSTRRAFTRFKCPKVDNTLLWLYKVTSADASKSFDLQLQYAINITDGPVHCLTFLPSGGYDAKANRLGMVAVGTAKNTVTVYALPLSVEKEMLSEETSENSSQNFTTLQLQPAWRLALDLSKKDLHQHPFVDTQCTALCWSEFSGHLHIFAGFSNGCVAYWDVSSDRNLNRLLIDGVPHYVPLNFFYTREKNVRAMALHYDSSGVRVIAVIVARRLLIMYDLYQFTQPFVMKEEITKNEATDLEWSPIWQSLAISMADSLPNNGRCIYAVNPTNIVFKNETIDKMNAGVNKIHYNPVQHVLANATDNGDVVLLDIREMHLKDIMRDSMRSSQAVAIMDMKCLNGTDIPKFEAKSAPADWSYNEEDCNEKYGLVFGPVTRIDKSLKAQYLSEQRRVPVHLTPCTRINTIHCNFNNHGKHLVAAGYENGFLRVFYIDRKCFFY